MENTIGTGVLQSFYEDNVDPGASRDKYKEAKDAVQKNLDQSLKVELKKLEQSVSFVGFKLSGSYSRSTNIKGSSDIDMLAIFQLSETKPDKIKDSLRKSYTPEEVIDIVFKSISAKYPTSSSRKQNRSIGLEISSKKVSFDVVPAFELSPGSDKKDQTYLIPDLESGKWIETMPHAAKALIKGRVKLRVLVRFMKFWNIENGKLIKNFALEVACYTFKKSDEELSGNIWSYLPALFEHVQTHLEDEIPGSNNSVSDNIKNKPKFIEYCQNGKRKAELILISKAIPEAQRILKELVNN